MNHIKSITPNAIINSVKVFDIPTYKGRYAITEDGKVWSYPKSTFQGRWMKSHIDKNGYCTVLLRKNTKKKHLKIHRLMGFTFLEKIRSKKFINHKDGNKKNNHVSNLEWCTSSENALHAYRITKTRKSPQGMKGIFGEQNPRSKIFHVKHLDGSKVKYYGILDFKRKIGLDLGIAYNLRCRGINEYTFKQGKVKGLTIYL